VLVFVVACGFSNFVQKKARIRAGWISVLTNSMNARAFLIQEIRQPRFKEIIAFISDTLTK